MDALSRGDEVAAVTTATKREGSNLVRPLEQVGGRDVSLDFRIFSA